MLSHALLVELAAQLLSEVELLSELPAQLLSVLAAQLLGVLAAQLLSALAARLLDEAKTLWGLLASSY